MQLELEQAKQKVEELALDLELLKAEMSEKGIEGAGSSLEIKQLEQQNIRMKETLVKYVFYCYETLSKIHEIQSHLG